MRCAGRPEGLLVARSNIDAHARAPAWQRMSTRAGWIEADLEVQLYARLA